MRYRCEARGVEQIPNLTFWQMIPGLIKVRETVGFLIYTNFVSRFIYTE